MNEVVVTFKVSRELLDKIDSLAFRLKMNRSELIRTAIIEYLQKHEDVKRKIVVKRYTLE